MWRERLKKIGRRKLLYGCLAAAVAAVGLCIVCVLFSSILQTLGLVPTRTPTIASARTPTQARTSTIKSTSTQEIIPTSIAIPTQTQLISNVHTSTQTSGAPVSGFILISISSPVSVGSYANVSIQTQPGVDCNLTYKTPKGTKSKAAGLGGLIADNDGNCSWRWIIGTSTAPGTGNITITAGSQTNNYPIEITK
jgi:hypothetical protein